MPADTGPDPLAVAALQARSIAARVPLARAAGASSVRDVVAGPGADPWLAGELARVVALQDLRTSDEAEALAILGRLRADRTIHPVHQGFHAQFAYAAGDRPLAATLLAEYTGVPPAVRAALRLDLSNPYAGGSGQDWAAGFAGLLASPAVRVTDGSADPIDRLSCGPCQRVGHDLRITSIVATRRPGPGLLTAVRSLVSQTWTNHEILVVDDASPDEFASTLAEAAALDPRVRLVRMVTAGGPNVARNAGLDAATGDFVAFQDGDGWSHPLRLEKQVLPLLADESLVGTMSDCLPVTGSLVVSRPGVTRFPAVNPSSLLVRRAAALNRVGHFDPVRERTDLEYAERVRAVFGPGAVRNVAGPPLALARVAGELPRSYRSAFHEWHARIRSGEATPVGRRTLRDFAAPRRMLGETGARAFDVILAGDWTTAGGTAGAGAGQLRALAARGLRVALLQLDVLTNLLGGPQDLDPGTQRLINDGELTQVELADDVRARLLVVRSAAALDHAPDGPSGVRAQRVVVETGSPSAASTAASRRLFGQAPLWAPTGPDGRRQLTEAAEPGTLTALDLPGTIDVAGWQLDRRGPRADRPVVGRHCRDASRAEWHRLRAEIPDSSWIDVRLLDDGGTAGPAFGKFGAPRSWLVYGPHDVTLRSFLYQVDFYLHLPAPESPADADPDVLAALAAGCVVVLPYRYAPTFGDAAVYCSTDEIPDTIRLLHGNRRALRAQSERGPDFVRRNHNHALYAERVAALSR